MPGAIRVGSMRQFLRTYGLWMFLGLISVVMVSFGISARRIDRRRSLQEGGVRALHLATSRRPACYQEIRQANLGLVELDEDRLIEMELGKNQCAAHIAMARV